jgi:hypothetical protein
MRRHKAILDTVTRVVHLESPSMAVLLSSCHYLQLPCIDILLDQLIGAKVFSNVDLH